MHYPPKPPIPLTRIIAFLELPSIWVGKAAAWLVLPLTLALVYEVVSRYIFNRPTIWAYDMTYMFAGALFMLGTPYALHKGAHVRLDFVLASLKPRWQALMDLILYLIVYFPAVYLFLTVGYAFALKSWQQQESMPTSAWSPAIYPLKTIIPITLFLLLVQGVAEVLKAGWTVRSNVPYPQSGEV
ncbi:MAG: TRAP transporter small permease subunit [Ottowia sp.]|nr:TRAP transporter small permease subunit [Ottowia sp.]